MKKIVLLAVAFLCVVASGAQDACQLPKPDKNVSMSLYQALQSRHSTRAFASRAVPDEMLSQLLWAALGINRDDGRLTAPTAKNAQDVSLYVCRADGAWLYDARANELKRVSQSDLRSAVAGRQTFAAKAPLSLVLVTDNARLGSRSTDVPTTMGSVDMGYVSQNICLACEALGLVTVPRATMDQAILRKELRLQPSQFAVINHPVGFAEKH